MKSLTIVAGALDASKKKAPEWVLLFKAGTIEMEGEGRFIVDRAGFDAMQADIARRGLDPVFDYEHQTLQGTEAPAAGWIKALRWSDQGIEAHIEWTPRAAEYIGNGEYRYFSPVFGVRGGRVQRLYSVALTNDPKTNHLRPLLAKLGAETNKETSNMEWLKKIAARLGLTETATEADVDKAVDALKARAGQTNKIAAKLGLTEDATEGDVDKALDTLKAGATTAREKIPATVIAALGLKETDGESTVVASIHALKQGEKTMVPRTEFDALKAKLAARDADEIVTAALKEGRITPDQKPWAEDYAARDPEGFKTFVAKAPQVVPVEKLPGGPAKSGGAALDDATLQVAKMFGNSEEDLKKYGGLESTK